MNKLKKLPLVFHSRPFDLVSILVSLVVLVTCAYAQRRTNTAKQDTRYRFVVTAVSADRGEPIGDAKVSIVFLGWRQEFGPFGAAHQLAVTGTAGDVGTAYLVYEDQGNYRVTIEHKDYDKAEQLVRATGASRDIRVPFSLTRKAGNKVVVVNLTAADDKQPVPEAKVVLDGGGNAFYTGTTDLAGEALLNVVEGGTYSVEITHSKFESIHTTLRVKGFDDEQKEYSLAYDMKRKKPVEAVERTLIVTVEGKDKGGNLVPIKYVGVNLPDGQFKITDRYGKCEMKHKFPPGETVKATIDEIKGYQGTSGSFVVKTKGEDSLTVTVEREGCKVPDVSGTYILTGEPKGILVLSQSGNHVTGSYGNDATSLVNTVEGDFTPGDECLVLSGKFKNTAYKTSGKFKYTFSSDGTSFTGSWGNDQDRYTGGWNGTRK